MRIPPGILFRSSRSGGGKSGRDPYSKAQISSAGPQPVSGTADQLFFLYAGGLSASGQAFSLPVRRGLFQSAGSALGGLLCQTSVWHKADFCGLRSVSGAGCPHRRHSSGQHHLPADGSYQPKGFPVRRPGRRPVLGNEGISCRQPPDSPGKNQRDSQLVCRSRRCHGQPGE